MGGTDISTDKKKPDTQNETYLKYNIAKGGLKYVYKWYREIYKYNNLLLEVKIGQKVRI